MHDTDHSKEHARAAAKVGGGKETNQISALDAVNAECKSIAKQQGGTHDQVDVGAAVEKGKNDIPTNVDNSHQVRGNGMGVDRY